MGSGGTGRRGAAVTVCELTASCCCGTGAGDCSGCTHGGRTGSALRCWSSWSGVISGITLMSHGSCLRSSHCLWRLSTSRSSCCRAAGSLSAPSTASRRWSAALYDEIWQDHQMCVRTAPAASRHEARDSTNLSLRPPGDVVEAAPVLQHRLTHVQVPRRVAQRQAKHRLDCLERQHFCARPTRPPPTRLASLWPGGDTACDDCCRFCCWLQLLLLRRCLCFHDPCFLSGTAVEPVHTKQRRCLNTERGRLRHERQATKVTSHKHSETVVCPRLCGGFNL